MKKTLVFLILFSACGSVTQEQEQRQTEVQTPVVEQQTVIQSSKHEAEWDYARRFVTLAKAEKQKFGIPISIILAQGLLESESGKGRLVQIANNHFGVMTFSENMPHVLIEGKKFKKYDSAWESYRDHSLLLVRDNYRFLQSLSKLDYEGWAQGLEKAGYSTEKGYAEKLINCIKNFQLFKLDEA